MTVIIGQFPGPTIEADWGDTIRGFFPPPGWDVMSNRDADQVLRCTIT